MQQHVVNEYPAQESVLETPAMATQPNIEPSSDDFLDEPILDIVETNVTPAMPTTM